MISGTVVGNLGKDAETRDAGGTPVVSFSVASSEKKGRDKEEQTTWVRCSFWGARAVAVSEFLVKGKSVAVSGTMSTREYEGQNGKGFSLEMNVDNLQLLGGGKERDEQPATNGSSAGSTKRIPF